MDDALTEFGSALAIIIGAYVISRICVIAFRRWLPKLADRTKTRIDNVVIAAAEQPVAIIIMLAGAQIAFHQFSFWTESTIAARDRIIFALYAIILFTFLFRLINGLFNWYGAEVAHRTETDLDDMFLDLFRRLVQITVIAIFIVVVLGRYGIEVTALVTTLGISSLAIALAAQETLSDIFSGFTIMLDRPYVVGDWIELSEMDEWGNVVSIGLRSTRIRTRDNRMVTVPNSIIGKGWVINHSQPDPIYRIETTVGVAYGVDIDMAKQTLIDAVQSQPWIVANRPVEALFWEFGDSSLNFQVRCWIGHFIQEPEAIAKLNTALYKALKEANIEIPFPQRDLHIISSNIGNLRGESDEST